MEVNFLTYILLRWIKCNKIVELHIHITKVSSFFIKIEV